MEDGRFLLQHYAPQAVAESIEADRHERTSDFLQMEFPTRCCRLLDGEKTLETEEDAEAFWTLAQRILADYQQEDGSIHRKQDTATGTAAVLLIKHRDWLKLDKGKENWCKQQILEAISDPPAAHQFDSPQSGAGWEWERFCADAMPILWSEDLISEDLRICMLVLCLDKHDQTIRVLSRRCHELRKELGESYLQLMALLRFRAIEQPQLLIRENLARGGYWLSWDQRMSLIEILNLPEEEINRYVSKEFVEAIKAFVKGTLSPVISSLLNVKPLPRPPKGNAQNRGRERRRRRYNIDIGTLQTMYSFLNERPLPTDKNERQECIELWQEILACFLETLQPDSEEEAELEIKGDFYEEDRWLLDKIALLIVQMQANEKPEQFWQPILDLGWQAHDYIEHFLFSFLLHNIDKLEDAAFSKKFVNLWSDMFRYADESSGWNRTSSNRTRHLDIMWQKMMGISWHGGNVWAEGHQLLIKERALLHQAFCSKRLTDARTTEEYLRFLYCSGAKLMRLEALLWVEPNLDDSQFDDEYSKVEDALATLAVTCWSEHEKSYEAHRTSSIVTSVWSENWLVVRML